MFIRIIITSASADGVGQQSEIIARDIPTAIAILQEREKREKEEATPTREDLQERVKRLEKCVEALYWLQPSPNSDSNIRNLQTLNRLVSEMASS